MQSILHWAQGEPLPFTTFSRDILDVLTAAPGILTVSAATVVLSLVASATGGDHFGVHEYLACSSDDRERPMSHSMNEGSHSARVGDHLEQPGAADPLEITMDGSRAEGSPIVGALWVIQS